MITLIGLLRAFLGAFFGDVVAAGLSVVAESVGVTSAKTGSGVVALTSIVGSVVAPGAVSIELGVDGWATLTGV